MAIDVDGGTQLLRVLIYLLLHPHTPLVSASLQLLFRIFNQRKELYQAMKQVRINFAWITEGFLGPLDLSIVDTQKRFKSSYI